MTVRKMARSSPAMPATVAPTSTFAGAIELPTDAPIDWMLAMVTAPIPSAFAVSTWSRPNITFEFVLLPLMNDPSRPMNGDRSGKTGPETSAMPRASSTVMPVSAITTAIITIAAMLSVELTLWRAVSAAASHATPPRQRLTSA